MHNYSIYILAVFQDTTNSIYLPYLAACAIISFTHAHAARTCMHAHASITYIHTG